ncbi:MAG TPA: hypothetical protein VEK57_30790 [Thermoanaerobaculia bacterium]|nr:hypothetical protein [Thermoanaerobaculia bacterium]
MRILALLLGVFLALAPAMLGDEIPSFFIESIRVNGGSPGSHRIVVAESRLRAGQTYDEARLRDATARIQRLPFVISADFRLAKGSEFGRYVLVIDIQQMKPFFVLAESTTSWSVETTRLPNPADAGEEFVRQNRSDKIAAGARMFVGAAGVLNLVAERVEHRPNDRYTMSYTQYDLFGTRASLTALASYNENPGARGRGAPGDRFDWHHKDNFTYELIGIVPIGPNDSIRASWQRGYLPIRYFRGLPGGGVQHIVRSLPEIRKELYWIHDTTDDPLFPTGGTRISAGMTRTHMASAGLTELGRQKLDEMKLSLDRTFRLTSAQALTLGGNGLDFDRSIRKYDVFARWSVDLWGRERTLRHGDLRLEIGGDRVYTRIQDDHFFASSTLRTGIVFRNEWGVLRLTGQYEGWRVD